MTRESVNQKNFNVGEIDPLLASRSDLKIYFAAVQLAENVVTTPLGPLMRRPGTTFVDYVRHILAPVNFTVDMVETGGSGGTAADAMSADGALFTTTAALGAAAAVLIQIDFVAPQTIHLIDVIDYAVVAGGGGAPTPLPAPITYPFPQPGIIEIGGLGGLGDLP